MHTHNEHLPARPNSRSAAEPPRPAKNGAQGFRLDDRRPAAGRLTQLAAILNPHPPVTPAPSAEPNRTGLPDSLKTGVEQLSGLSLDHVRVHRNSSEPARLNAHAYAQGGEIHLAPGQEQHLPHEAWHVVQQAQGRVKATHQLKGIDVNSDAMLEREADAMGDRAARWERGQSPGDAQDLASPGDPNRVQPATVRQLKIVLYGQDKKNKINSILNFAMEVDDSTESGVAYLFGPDNWNEDGNNWISETAWIQVKDSKNNVANIGLHLNVHFSALRHNDITNVVDIDIKNFHVTVRPAEMQKKMDKIGGATADASISLHKGVKVAKDGSGAMSDAPGWNTGSKSDEKKQETVSQMGEVSMERIEAHLKGVSPARLFALFTARLLASLPAPYIGGTVNYKP